MCSAKFLSHWLLNGVETTLGLMFTRDDMCRPVARIFRGKRGGEGEGGANLKNRDRIINVGMIGHASSKDTRVEI